jgi:hypothetical protein
MNNEQLRPNGASMPTDTAEVIAQFNVRPRREDRGGARIRESWPATVSGRPSTPSRGSPPAFAMQKVEGSSPFIRRKARACRRLRNGSDRTRTRDLRRDRPLPRSRHERRWAPDRSVHAVSRIRVAATPHGCAGWFQTIAARDRPTLCRRASPRTRGGRLLEAGLLPAGRATAQRAALSIRGTGRACCLQ